MTDLPLIELIGVVKSYGVPQALRIDALVIRAGDRLALSGFDQAAAETLINLITGASLPDEGVVQVGGRDTRAIATDTEWLASLDRFGIVTSRAVLIGPLPTGANMALPLTLSIDPMSAATRAEVEALAELVGLDRGRLDAPASTLGPAELVRVHLARALAPKPEFVLLEHPTARIADIEERRTLGRTLRAAASGRDAGWLALTEDREFSRSSNSTQLSVTPTGVVRRESVWKRLTRLG
jgi:predicted ABC-type transport system involved in lysophospholipase L1 biosynthesis ATPase subunit